MRAAMTLGPVARRTAMLDPARITQAMLQLAQNAVTHGGGRIEMGSAAVADTVELWVRDHGPGVADEAKSQVFERFQRGTEAQVRSGSGLGLHIVQVITRAHHGAVRVEDAPGGGALFILSVPAPPAVQPPQDLAGDVVIPPRPPLPHDNETSSPGGR